MAVDGLVPALVVVDTWNLRNQCYDLLGERRFPSVAGIRRGLAAFGFDAVHVYAGVAVDRPSGGVSRALERRLAGTDRFVADVGSDPYGTVLRGRIVERDGQPEEKLVDVLCALRVLRCATEIATGRSPARTVVVISEDIDLTPAYGMAAELGVPVFAAANETVHTRPGSWLLIGDSVMVDFCGRATGSTQGARRRAEMVSQLLTHRTARRWTYRYHDGRTGRDVFRHRSGIEGFLVPGAARRPGVALELFPVGIDFGPRRQSFPSLALSATPVSALPDPLIEAKVIQWSQPTRVEVQLAGGRMRTLEAVPGSATSGDRVLVDDPPGRRPRLVGTIGSTGRLDDWSDPTRPKLAETVRRASSPGALVRVRLPTGGQVALVPPSGTQPVAGDRFAVTPVRAEAGTISHVTAVSSILP